MPVRSSLGNSVMDNAEFWEQRQAILDGISAALAYVDDQLEDLRAVIVDESEHELARG